MDERSGHARMRAEAAAGRSIAMLDQVIAHRAVHAHVMVEALGVDASMVNATL